MWHEYPYTDAHELNLDWFLARFKEYYEKTVEQDQKITTMEETVEQFTSFVTNYFDNLDVQQEINNKLDAMAASGELQAMLQPYFDHFVEMVDDQIMTQNTRINNLQSQIDAIVAPDPDPSLAEVATARVDLYGHTFASLKSRLDYDSEHVGSIDLLSCFEVGDVSITNSGWSYSSSDKRVRTKQGITLHLYPGDVVGLSDTTNASYYIGIKHSNNTYTYYGWIKTAYTATEDCEVVVLIKNDTEAVQTSSEALASLFYGYHGVVYDDINRLSAKNIADNKIYYNTVKGYLSADGTIARNNIGTTKDVTTEYIPVNNGDIFHISFSYPSVLETWIGYVLYDENKASLGRTVPINNSNRKLGEIYFTINNVNAKYVRIAYRTYGVIDISIYNDRASWLVQNRFKEINSKELFNLYKLNENIKSVNHRGYHLDYPENTLPAFKESKRNGFKIVETDIRFTSDNVPVLIHDASLNATCCNAADGSAISGTVNIRDITYAESLDYDACKPTKWDQYHGIKIPRLTDFLALCRKLGLDAYLELKTGDETKVQQLADIVTSYGMDDHVTWIGSIERLGYIHSVRPKARLGWVTNQLSDVEVAAFVALRGDNEIFADYDNIHVTDAVISTCITNSLPLEVWTVDYEPTIIALNPYITGVTSNYTIAGAVLFQDEFPIFK